MIAIKENTSLRPFNTFGIDVKAKYFCSLGAMEQLRELVQTDLFRNERRMLLGGGSNVLFTKDFEGLVIQNSIQGIEGHDETDEHITLRVSSVVTWHQFVLHCVDHDWGGVENLSLIPGTVGATPIQNIGAYGVEISEVIEKLEAFDFTNGVMKSFAKDECGFGYRESVFKTDFKEKIFISSVTLRLTKKNHRFNTSYGAISDTLQRMHIEQPSIQSIINAVIKIRTEKLPDFNTMGNAGSFFKNPEITEQHFLQLQNNFANIPHYHAANQRVKVPAGWLIEQCGWKGKKINHVGVHAMQALVLVNFGGAKGEEIFQLATQIMTSV